MPLLNVVSSIRPVNCLMAAIAIWIGASISSGKAASIDIAVSSGMFSGAALLAFANLLNDHNDRTIDLRKELYVHSNHRIRHGNGLPLMFFLLAISMVAAVICVISSRSLWAGAIFAFALLLVIIYEEKLKERGLPGNAVVGILSGSLFLYGGSFLGPGPLIVIISISASLASMAREIIKDIQDMSVDEGLRSTLPMKIGYERSSLIALGSGSLGSIASFYPILTAEGGIVYAVLVLVAGLFTFISIMKVLEHPDNARNSQNIIKFAMVVSMVAYVSIFTIGTIR